MAASKTRTSKRRQNYGKGAMRGSSYIRGKQRARASRQKRKFQLPKFMMAQIDPFHPDSYNVRVPDESTAPSSAFYLFDSTNLRVVINATNAAASYFYPSCAAVCATSTEVSSATWAWPAAYGGVQAPSRTALAQAQYSVARPVAHGVKIACPLAPTSVTGFCHIALYTLDLFGNATWTLPTTVSQMTECPFYRRVTLASLTQTPLVVVNKYLDQTAFRYTDTGSNEALDAPKGAFHVPGSWMGIMVVVEGHTVAAGTSIVNVETICHLEGQSKFGGLNTDGQAEQGNIYVQQQAANASSRASPSYMENSQEAFSRAANMASNFVGNAASVAGQGFASGVVNAVGGAVANAMGGQGMDGVNDNPDRLSSR